MRSTASAPSSARPSASRRPPSDSQPAAQRFDGRTNRKASPDIRARLAQNVKRLRRARGLTQRALAKRCGFITSYIGHVEQRKVNISLANLEALAWGLGCSANDLLGPPP